MNACGGVCDFFASSAAIHSSSLRRSLMSDTTSLVLDFGSLRASSRGVGRLCFVIRYSAMWHATVATPPPTRAAIRSPLQSGERHLDQVARFKITLAPTGRCGKDHVPSPCVPTRLLVQPLAKNKQKKGHHGLRPDQPVDFSHCKRSRYAVILWTIRPPTMV